jgi:hypothetical protein
MGRIFRTSEVFVYGIYPEEVHTPKRLGVPDKGEFCVYMPLPAFAHFEIYMKPWRRTGLMSTYPLLPAPKKIPEILKRNPYYIERFEKKNG